jgi:hypothetical protein
MASCIALPVIPDLDRLGFPLVSPLSV